MSANSMGLRPCKVSTPEEEEATPGMVLRDRNASPPKSLHVMTSWSISVKTIIAPSAWQLSRVAGLRERGQIIEPMLTRGYWSLVARGSVFIRSRHTLPAALLAGGVVGGGGEARWGPSTRETIGLTSTGVQSQRRSMAPRPGRYNGWRCWMRGGRLDQFM